MLKIYQIQDNHTIFTVVGREKFSLNFFDQG